MVEATLVAKVILPEATTKPYESTATEPGTGALHSNMYNLNQSGWLKPEKISKWNLGDWNLRTLVSETWVIQTSVH